MATISAHARISEVESYMNQKGQEYRTIDKTRARRIYERLKAYIDPPKRTIQILGTNGKGSTGRFLTLMLMQNDAKVLHFTSPHIFSFNERFYCNGSVVGDSELTKAHRFLQRFDFISECSYFEYATFLALVLAQGVDYLILEAGVGGELDSTSVIPRDLCVFSVIDYDHTEILGESIEAIATTKLNAVFYPDRVNKMLLGAQKYEIVEKIAREIARKHNIAFYTLDSANQTQIAESALDSVDSQNLVKNNSVRSTQNSPASWCKKSESKGAEVPPADFLLEAEKRGSPPKSEKRQLLGNSFKNSWGERGGGAALLRKENGKSNSKRIIGDSQVAKMDYHESGEIRGATHDSLDCFGDESHCNDAIQSYLTKHRLADFLKPNLILALKALEILGLKCDLDSLPKLDLRGRFEQIAPNIIIDVGHNQNAAFAIKQNLGQKKVILVYNSYFQKNISEILSVLRENIKRVEILRVADNPRIIEQNALEHILKSLKIHYSDFKGVDCLKSSENYLVFGSFSVVETFMRKFESKSTELKSTKAKI